jgi:hypothetical protein
MEYLIVFATAAMIALYASSSAAACQKHSA